jgi:hypothetical protein
LLAGDAQRLPQRCFRFLTSIFGEQSRSPLGPGDGLATTTSYAACATGNSAKWRLAEDFSRQVMARL